MRGGGFSCFPYSPLRVPYLWAFIGSSFVFYKLLLLIKKKKKKKWSRSIQMVIRGKGKIGYLDGTLPKPSSDLIQSMMSKTLWSWLG